MPVRLIVIISLSLFPILAGAEPLILEVNAGKHAREPGLPLICELPIGLKEPGSARLFAVAADGKQSEDTSIAAQIIPGGKTRVVWILEAGLEAGESRPYQLDLRPPAEALSEKKKKPALSSQMNCLETGSKIEILNGAKPVLEYNKGPTESAAGNEPFYSRTGYIHPLFSPAGVSVTGDYAADHPHQHGLFFAWTNTTFEGRDINFWDQKSQTARISWQSTIKTQSGPVFGQFAVMHLHEDLSAPGGPKAVLNERWLVRAFRTGRNFHLLDIHSTQSCSGKSPLTINQYHYGGMAIRGADEWFINEKNAKQPSDFLTGEGKTRADGNHSAPNWVDLHGTFGNDSKAGVAIFCHPDNFRAPQPVRLHPTKPYFVFTPQVESGFAIEAGKPHVSQYRYLVHNGEPDPALLEQAWRDYSEPPKITVVTKP